MSIEYLENFIADSNIVMCNLWWIKCKQVIDVMCSKLKVVKNKSLILLNVIIIKIAWKINYVINVVLKNDHSISSDFIQSTSSSG